MDKEDQLYASKYKKSAAKTANITKITMIEKKKREQRETLVELNSDSDLMRMIMLNKLFSFLQKSLGMILFMILVALLLSLYQLRIFLL